MTPLHVATYLISATQKYFLFPACRPPSVPISFEFPEYTIIPRIHHNIRRYNFALQVCAAVVTDIPFAVEASLDIINGAAQG